MPRAVAPKSATLNELELIELVKRHPELYEPNHQLAKDQTHENRVWESIAVELNVSADALRKLWKKLQDNYLRKSSREPTSVRNVTRSSVYDEALAFLADGPTATTNRYDRASSGDCGSSEFSGPEDARSLRSEVSIESGQTMVQDEPIQSTSSDGVVEASNGSERSSPDAVARDCRYAPRSTLVPTTDRVLRPRLSEPSQLASKQMLRRAVVDSTQTATAPAGRNRAKRTPNPNDPTRIFFESMALTVATFPQHLQAAVKVQVCDIVAETEYGLHSPKLR